MRLYVASQMTLPRAIQEIAALTITHPVEITVKRAERRMTDAKRARLHIAIRDCARHFGYSEDGFKALLKRGEVPGVTWPGSVEEGALGGVYRAKKTMGLTRDEAEQVLLEIEVFGSEHGVEWSAHDTMEVA